MKAQGLDIFIGRVGSGAAVMKSAEHRDKIANQHNIIGFEMEGAGLWDELPSIVIKVSLGCIPDRGALHTTL
jgi:nucleoside phosphorylase